MVRRYFQLGKVESYATRGVVPFLAGTYTGNMGSELRRQKTLTRVIMSVDFFVESEVVGAERKEEAGPRGLSLASVLVEERVSVFLEAK